MTNVEHKQIEDKVFKIIENWDASYQNANFSRHILEHTNNWDKGNYLVLAGNLIYQTLLAENHCEKLQGGDTEFRRSQGLNSTDVLVLNLQNLEAIKFREYDV